MTITSVTLQPADGPRDSAEWVAGSGNQKRYVEIYQVIGDDPEESKVDILSHPDLPVMIVDAYPDDPQAFVMGKRVERWDGTNTAWRVEVTYSVPRNALGNSEDPETPVSPLDRYEVWWDTEEFEEPVYEGYLKTGGSFATTKTAITNSAHDPYNPPLTRIYSDRIGHVVFRIASSPPSWIWSYENAVNSDAFVLDGNAFSAGTCMIRRISVSWWQSEAGVAYREVRLDVHHRKDGWVKAPIDEGWHYIDTTPEDPDEYVKYRAADQDSEPLGEMVLLDGSGGVLDLSVSGVSAHFREYKVYDELAFSALGVFF